MDAQLIFINEFSEREAFEASSRGYLSHVLVKLKSGRLYPVIFYDAVRLKQDLDELATHGESFISDPGMIILQEVTREAMETAVQALAGQGLFEHFVPTTMDLANASHGEWPPRVPQTWVMQTRHS